MQCFLSQDYPEKRLLILDDGDDKSFPNGIDHPLIDYHCLNETVRHLIPAKRNMACEMAEGPILAHFDSDDFSSVERLSYQVRMLQESGKQLAGFHTMLFYNEQTREVWKYYNQPEYILGTSLVFFKSFWESFHFPEKYHIGSDNQIVRHAKDQKQLISADAGQMLIARIHESNTSSKRTGPKQSEYKRASIDDIPKAFFE